MIKNILLWILLSVSVPQIWIQWTARDESNYNNLAIGDKGRSRGAYQIQERTWKRYNKNVSWKIGAHDSKLSRKVCEQIIKDCIRKCKKDHKKVTYKNVRYYYTHGGF